MMDLVAASTRGFSSKRPLPRVLFLGPAGVGENPMIAVPRKSSHHEKLGVPKTEEAKGSKLSGHFGEKTHFGDGSSYGVTL